MTSHSKQAPPRFAIGADEIQQSCSITSNILRAVVDGTDTQGLTKGLTRPVAELVLDRLVHALAAMLATTPEDPAGGLRRRYTLLAEYLDENAPIWAAETQMRHEYARALYEQVNASGAL